MIKIYRLKIRQKQNELKTYTKKMQNVFDTNNLNKKIKNYLAQIIPV